MEFHKLEILGIILGILGNFVNDIAQREKQLKMLDTIVIIEIVSNGCYF